MLKMIDLPYPINALEPYYSRETLDLHYNVLYKGYLDNTNKTEEKLQKARETGEFSNIKCMEKDLSFFVSGAIRKITTKIIHILNLNYNSECPIFKN